MRKKEQDEKARYLEASQNLSGDGSNSPSPIKFGDRRSGLSPNRLKERGSPNGLKEGVRPPPDMSRKIQPFSLDPKQQQKGNTIKNIFKDKFKLDLK